MPYRCNIRTKYTAYRYIRVGTLSRTDFQMILIGTFINDAIYLRRGFFLRIYFCHLSKIVRSLKFCNMLETILLPYAYRCIFVASVGGIRSIGLVGDVKSSDRRHIFLELNPLNVFSSILCD